MAIEIDDRGIVSIAGRMVGYLFTHNGVAFSPDGSIGVLMPAQIAAHNAALDRLTIFLVDNAAIGDRGTLYAHRIPFGKANVKTWLGETVAVGDVRGSVITFYRRATVDGPMRVFRGRLQKNADCFNYRRVR